ncbi:hypothetical protein KDC22_14265 [Paenibacillus tritici]|nr:hypothetical protein [Paenibacillus tritici]QUL57531.1 hypothetical protein KDC22_14265 [Paenibacillus tritici]
MMTDERLKQRHDAWKRMNQLKSFVGRGLQSAEIDWEINILEKFLQTREG